MQRGLLVEERGTVQRLMQDPLVVRMDLIRADWLERQLADGRGWRDQDTVFPLWLCLCLEIWLRRFWDDTRTVSTCTR
jgi:hypothetical protein